MAMIKLLLLAALVQVVILQVQAGKPDLKPMAVYPLTKEDQAKDILGNNKPGTLHNVAFSEGPRNAKGGAFYFKGVKNSYVEFPNNGGLNAKGSITLCSWIKHEGDAGPIFNYKTDRWGVHFWMTGKAELFARFTQTPGLTLTVNNFIATNKIKAKKWQFACAVYDGKSGYGKLFVNSKFVADKNMGKGYKLATKGDVRMGVKIHDKRYFKGSISCMQVYQAALTEKQILQHAKDRCFHRHVEHHLNCLPNDMEVDIKKPTKYTHYSDLRLLDPACVPANRDKVFHIKFSLDKCGTEVKTTPTHLIYTNYVRGKEIDNKKAIISRVKDISIKLECKYLRKKELTSDKLEPNQDKFRDSSSEKGKFEFDIKLYRSNKFNKSINKFPAKMHLRQPVFVELFVKNKRNQLAILAKTCYATPKEHGSKVKYDLIKNSCPAADKTVKLLKSPAENIQRFRFQAFIFNKKQKYVYIHCQVITCLGGKKGSVCAKGCQNPKKLGKREESNIQSVIEPLALRNHDKQDTELDNNLDQSLDEAVSMPLEISN